MVTYGNDVKRIDSWGPLVPQVQSGIVQTPEGMRAALDLAYEIFPEWAPPGYVPKTTTGFYAVTKAKPDFGSPYAGGSTYLQPYIAGYPIPSTGLPVNRNRVTISKQAMPQSPIRRTW